MSWIGRGRSRASLASGVLIAALAAASIGRNTDFQAPPRFDGAGYAVLGLALSTGHGYCQLDHPERPRHAHFPPGYPAALAVLWRAVGRSVPAAHGLSMLCTLAATLAAWSWFRAMYPPKIALALGLALALNWTWGRIGGAIQSEPLYVLLEQTAILIVLGTARRGGMGRGAVLGVVLAACMLTRQVGVCLALAAGLDLLARGRRSAALAAGLVAAILILPWIVWLASVRHDTQAGLLIQGGLIARVAWQALFYVQRLPDQWTGPVVEIGTVFRRSTVLFVAVNVWAVAATGVVVWGWSRTLRTPRRRLAGLVPCATLPLLLVWPFTEAGRFLIPLVPCLLVGAVEGLAAIASRLRLRPPRAWAVGAVLAASIPYAGYSLATNRAEVQRRSNQDFDAACAWITARGSRPGPILTRHPGEVFWQTRRKAIAPGSTDPEAIASLILKFRVAYLLIDEDRYANAPPNPLSRFILRHPERVRRAWVSGGSGSSMAIFAVEPG